ncbi:MAG: N-acetylmannosamine kinase [Devosia sp.]|uniref:ROK family protein n=1 Tax=Devosia sp. TaxID=1871048 RepID=UPI00260CD8D3|nr:ROK family protein [Devosia sp.]MDB5539735.1 N-acetylmannosamine kinase [Devosia sp.]
MIICLDIGGSGIKGALAKSPSDLTPLGRVATPLEDFAAFVAAIRGVAERAAPADVPVAISITGVVDPATGTITCANIPCIDGRQLAAELSARLGRQVFVANDADCFAIAEAIEGAGRGHRIVFGAILGTGVGGGLVIDGHIVNGAGGFAGEWGHGPVAATSAGTPPVAIPRFNCGCGQIGCVDTVGGARGLERLYKHLHGVDLASTAIVEAWRAGDAAARRTIEVQVDLLAGPLALVVNVVGAGIVPVGGGLGKVREIIALLDTEVRKRILRRLNQPLVVPSQLTVEPGLVGAAILGFTEHAA